MTASAKTVKAICAVLALGSVMAASAAAAPALPGVPADASLLFALESRSGRVAPDARARKDHFTLTLKGVGRRATWFTDRPRRNAGQVSSGKLFGAWRELGFRASPPNAALVVDRAKPGRDTVAVELRLRSYDKRRRTARFAARTLGSLGGGLRHINRRLDRRPPRRFAGASLFIDNADYYSGEVCTIGQLKLMAYNPAYAADPPVLPEGMLAANGEILSVNDNAALYSVLGIAFGGDGFSTFALPDISAPPDLGWFICSDGLFPRRGQLTPCVPGEVDYWTMTGGFSDPRWLPADGRTVPASLYPAYASAYGTGDATLQLPDVPAPEGMEALVCVDNEGADLPGPTLGQVDLFPGPPPQGAGSWLPAAGQVVPTSANSGLYPLLYVYSRNPIVNAFAPNPPPTFQLPAPEAPGPGLEYYINSNGAWPLQFE